MKYKLHFAHNTYRLKVGSCTHKLKIESRIYNVAGDKYDGEYTFTPSEYTQTIEIVDKVASQNIIINPIPQNYGLITWDGSTLTVS